MQTSFLPDESLMQTLLRVLRGGSSRFFQQFASIPFLYLHEVHKLHSDHEVEIPHMKNYRQKALFVLAPKSNYEPHMDSRENSNAFEGNEVKEVDWNSKEFNLNKNVSLRMNSSYSVILRIYGRLTGNDLSTNDSAQFATIDCPQMYGKSHILWTSSFQCLNGQTIPAIDVCNSQVDCSDESDESICVPNSTPFTKSLEHFVQAVILMGFACYLFSFVLACSSNITIGQTAITNKDESILDVKESFTTIRKACLNAKTLADDRVVINEENENEIQSLYTKLHAKGQSNQLILYETVCDFKLDERYEQPCSSMIDNFVNTEENLHRNDNRKSTCMETTLRLNYDVSDEVIGTIDRNSIFSRAKKAIISVPKYIIGPSFPEVSCWILILLTVLLSIKNIGFSYFDVILDVKFFSSLQHIMRYFIGDKDKALFVTNLPMEKMGYLYLSCSITSQLCYFAICFKDFQQSFNLTNSWIQKVLFGLAVLFPIHFAVLDLGKHLIRRMILKNKFRKSLQTTMKIDSEVENAAHEYVEYRNNLKQNMNSLLHSQRTMTKLLIVEFTIENVPQIATAIVFLISELESEYGKLLTIVVNGIVKSIGGDINLLCILMVLVQLNKFTASSLIIRNRNQFPMGNGIGGTVILMISNAVMIGAKIGLITICFSHALHFFPILIASEFVIVTGYMKLTNITLHLTDTILPCLITPALLLIPNDDFRPKIEKKSMELSSVISLHLLNLVFAYTPLYAIIQYWDFFEDSKSLHPEITHLIVTISYIMAILVYGFLFYIFKKCFDPWRHLRLDETLPKNSNNEIEDPFTQKDGEIETISLNPRPKYEVDLRAQDPIEPMSFMVRNKAQINRLIEEKSHDFTE